MSCPAEILYNLLQNVQPFYDVTVESLLYQIREYSQQPEILQTKSYYLYRQIILHIYYRVDLLALNCIFFSEQFVFLPQLSLVPVSQILKNVILKFWWRPLLAPAEFHFLFLNVDESVDVDEMPQNGSKQICQWPLCWILKLSGSDGKLSSVASADRLRHQMD